MEEIYVTIYTKEKGKLEFTEEECSYLNISTITFYKTKGSVVDSVYGCKHSCAYGILHRLDGPSIEYSDGYKRYYIDGKHYSEEEFNQIINEVRKLSKTEKLIDERWWVREFI